MTKIAFKVSARTARLIGRENVANAEGALIELVKNSYDADAKTCIVFFDNKYNSVPSLLDKIEFKELNNEISNSRLISYCYYLTSSNNYVLKDDIDESTRYKLFAFFKSKCKIYIVDNGDGMTDRIIKNQWMTIGTDDKYYNIYTKTGRVKSGAKGIGRFALDRLGEVCEMHTVPRGKTIGYKWSVNWGDFEKRGAVLGDVKAEFSNITKSEFQNNILNIGENFQKFENVLNNDNYNNGTVIKISNLRDDWNDNIVEKVYSNLEILIPPKEEKPFTIDIKTSLFPNKYGEVKSSICDDYDYKLKADVKEDGAVEITVYRNELDLNRIIDLGLFKIEKMKTFPYDLKTFRKRKYYILKTINEMLPGIDEDQQNIIFKNIGKFDFTFYFMKRGQGPEEKKYPYKNINIRDRVNWLDKFGGIKLFRDNFRVRPYGEVESSSFDWLGLGERAAKSPTVTKKGYKVRPTQVSGVINISRITNINFEDTSSREGLQENRTFYFFRELLQNIIAVFEKDRNEIMRSVKERIDIIYKKEKTKSEADEIVDKYKSDDHSDKSDSEKSILASAIQTYKEELEDLRDEQKLLRILASTGLIITSFAHELNILRTNIIPRTDNLGDVLKDLINHKMLQKIPEEDNPFIILKDLRKEDERLKHWLDFSIAAVRKDKRTRKKTNLIEYITEFQKSWSRVLNERSIRLNVDENNIKDIPIRAFEIDLDGILNNLLVNSFEAFKRKGFTGPRNVNITFELDDNNIILLYMDSGPGLVRDIKDPYIIFEPFFTTKRDRYGNKIGTGLGMWIVKSAIDDYNGIIELLTLRPGFKLKISLPKQNYKGFEYG